MGEFRYVYTDDTSAWVQGEPEGVPDQFEMCIEK